MVVILQYEFEHTSLRRYCFPIRMYVQLHMSGGKTESIERDIKAFHLAHVMPYMPSPSLRLEKKKAANPSYTRFNAILLL